MSNSRWHAVTTNSLNGRTIMTQQRKPTRSLLCIVFLMYVCPIVAVEPTQTNNGDRKELSEKWYRFLKCVDNRELTTALNIGIEASELARRSPTTREFQCEIKAFAASIKRFTALDGNERKLLAEALRLRTSTNSSASYEETARTLKSALTICREVTLDEDDIFLQLLKSEILIAESQGSNTTQGELDAIVTKVDKVDQECVQKYGKATFLHTFALGARVKVLQRKADWSKAAETAEIRAGILEEILPASSYHIQSLEDCAASLAFLKRYRDARIAISKACKIVETSDRYRFDNLGVTAYVLSGQIALFEERMIDAEVDFEKGQDIVDALEDGAIAKNIVAALDKYHAACLIQQGKLEEARRLQERRSGRF